MELAQGYRACPLQPDTFAVAGTNDPDIMESLNHPPSFLGIQSCFYLQWSFPSTQSGLETHSSPKL